MHPYLKLLPLLLTLSHISTARCQELVFRVIDKETLLPVKNAVVEINDSCCLTMEENSFHLNNVTSVKTKVYVKAIGYEENIVFLESLKHTQTIRLNKKYNSLAATEIRAKKINADSLIMETVNRIPENYVPADLALPMDYSAYLHTATDTQLAATAPIYWHNNENRNWLQYEKLIALMILL